MLARIRSQVVSTTRSLFSVKWMPRRIRPRSSSTSPSEARTIFALRMTNQEDQDFVRASMSDASGGLLDTLPALANAEAIVVGEAISVPMRMRVKDLPPEQRPKSATADFAGSWSEEGDAEGKLQTIVERWRHQRR